MTQSTPDSEEIIQEENIEEGVKSTIPSPKISKFGNTGFQGGSKFGKGPTGANPQLKQRPGRAAARGR